MEARTCILIFLSVLAAIIGISRQQQGLKSADLVMVVDGSNSVGEINFKRMKTSMINLVMALNISDTEVHVGLILFGDIVYSTIPLTGNKTYLIEQIRDLMLPDDQTRVDLGIDAALKLFQDGGRTGDVARLMLILIDGPSTKPNKTIASSKAAKDMGITIFVIGITNKSDPEELENMASSENQVYHTGDFIMLEGALNNATNRACVDLRYNNCSQFCILTNISGSSCHNIDGTCLQGCQSGYKPPMCYKPCDPGTYGENCKFVCQKGYQVMKCEQICDVGTFGEGCQSNCSQFCNKTDNSTSPCHHINGTCLKGCQSGYTGPECQQFEYSGHQMHVAAIAVPVVVGILIVGAIIGVLIWRRKRSKTNKNVNTTPSCYNTLEFEDINSRQVDSPYEVFRPDTDSSAGIFIKQTGVLKQFPENITSQKQPKDEAYYNTVSIIH